MTCKEMQSLIPEYIHHNISDENLKQFVNHVKICDTCYDDLEITYIVEKALKGLDDDNTIIYNVKDALKNDLAVSENRIHNLYMFQIFKYFTTTLAVVGTIILFIMWCFTEF